MKSINTLERLINSIKNLLNFSESGRKIIIYNAEGLVIDDIDVRCLHNNSLLYISFNCKKNN